MNEPIQLHYLPGAASMAPHAVLVELGLPHRLVMVDRSAQGAATPEYLRLNPLGRVPTVVDGHMVLTESAAICMHYADAHPGAGLAPPPATRDRAEWFRWHCHLTNTVQPTFMRFRYPHRVLPAGAGPEMEAAVATRAEEELGTLGDLVAAHLADRTWMVGDAFGTVDIWLCMVTRWTRWLGHPWWARPAIAAHFRRVADRPALRLVWEREGLDRDGEPA
ncbi:MAG: glutathione S-transferase family protein [Thermoleophilia bacterium]